MMVVVVVVMVVVVLSVNEAPAVEQLVPHRLPQEVPRSGVGQAGSLLGARGAVQGPHLWP